MSDKATQEEYIRGQQAEAVLTNEAYSRSFDTIERKLFDDFANTKWYQHKLRESIYQRVKALKLQKQALEAEMQGGKLAKKRLEAR